nr:hypothetical protein [Salipiger aestuarii]
MPQDSNVAHRIGGTHRIELPGRGRYRPGSRIFPVEPGDSPTVLSDVVRGVEGMLDRHVPFLDVRIEPSGGVRHGQTVRTGPSYRAIAASARISVSPSARACAISIRSNGSRCSNGSVPSASACRQVSGK